jgi:acyl-homoserine-lactone acylase
MNKAASFSEFYGYLKMNALPGYNIGYADKNDTIFYISNGKIPVREPGYDWKSTVPGNTYKTLWNTYYPTEALPQVISPKSGFVYNANHSPFKSSGVEDNPNPADFDPNMDYELYDNNRSTRLFELLNTPETINFEDFKTIKYDHTLPTPLNYNYVDFNAVFDMNPADYPEVSDLLQTLRDWDRKAAIDSHGAGIFATLYYTLRNAWPYLGPDKTFTKELLLTALKVVRRDLTNQFGTTQITLGTFQNLIRGDKKLPIWGLPDVITAMHGQPQETGPYRITNGESYIALIQFTPEETHYQSVISYGNSNRPDSPHFNDQMELYQQFKTKPMSFNREEVLKTSVKRYFPGQ